MDNKDRENLICFLAKFQAGGEPSKDIFSRYPTTVLIKDILVPLQLLTAEVKLYIESDEDVENSMPFPDEMLYPFREDQKVLRIGVRSNEENRFDWLYEVRSSCLIELSEKAIDSIMQFLSDRSTCGFCFCEWIDGLDHGGQCDHYFLLKFQNDQEGRYSLKKFVMEHLENSMPV